VDIIKKIMNQNFIEVFMQKREVPKEVRELLTKIEKENSDESASSE
jgi:hypothetical protein